MPDCPCREVLRLCGQHGTCNKGLLLLPPTLGLQKRPTLHLQPPAPKRSRQSTHPQRARPESFVSAAITAKLQCQSERPCDDNLPTESGKPAAPKSNLIREFAEDADKHQRNNNC